MRATEKRHVRADQGSGSYGDLAGVDECAVEINKNSASDTDVCTVVDVDGSFKPGIGVQGGIFVFFCGCRCWREWLAVICYSFIIISMRLLRIGRKAGVYSFQYSATSRRLSSPALLNRLTTRAHRFRAATSCGVKA